VTKRFAVVVDPVSTGRGYAAEFAAEGVEVVAALSGSEQLPIYVSGWEPENYRHIHRLGPGGMGALAAELRRYEPICIIPGAECGVPLYEALTPLVLPGTGNVPELAGARRDKWQMAQALRSAGVPALRQRFTHDEAEVEQWLAEAGLADAELVLKPANSSGADDVHLVPRGGDWRTLFRRMRDDVNMEALPNNGVLVQEHARGTEYLVDTYSVDGRHGLVDVCRYRKVSNGDRIGLYDVVEFLPPEDPDIAVVLPYLERCLDALGIVNGCGHGEVMVTADGPRLIEVAERPAGGGHQMISAMATGDNHLKRTVAHRVHGRFAPGYRLRQHLRAVFLMLRRGGVWINGDLFDAIEDLPTFALKHLPYRGGDVVPYTRSIGTTLGWVILAGPDNEQIEADYRVLKELESRIEIA
jgi:hypothetical protein